MNDYRALFPIFLALQHGAPTHVETDRLLVQKFKDRRAFNHSRQGILKRFGGTDPAMVNHVKQIPIDRLLTHELLHEIRELPRLITDKERSRSVPFLIDFRRQSALVLRHIVMQIRAWDEIDVVVLHHLRIVRDKAGIGISLIGRMAHHPLVVRNICTHAEMHFIIHNLSLAPLFELDDDDIIVHPVLCAENDEIHPLRRLRDIVFDGNLNVIVYLRIIHDIAHEHHGVMPGLKFPLLPGIQSLRPDERQYLIRDIAIPHIIDELTFATVIDYHFKCVYSLK